MATVLTVPTVQPRPVERRYTPARRVADSQRTGALRARVTCVRRLEQLLAAGQTDAAVRFALPINALLDTIPADAVTPELVGDAGLGAAFLVAALERHRRGEATDRQLLARLHAAITAQTRLARALERRGA